LASSGARSATYVAGTNAAPNPGDGYWQPNGKPVITGYIKIDAQTAYDAPCGTWKDVTQEILSLGYAGPNMNPVYQSSDAKTVKANWTYNGDPSPKTGDPTGYFSWLPGLPAAQIKPSTCSGPHPNAIIRIEHIRDNPSSVQYSQQPAPVGGWTPPASTVAQQCGVDTTTAPLTVLATAPSDYWPNVLFDTREGTQRDTFPAAPYNTMVTLGGTMHYVELDVNNLARWFSGAIGTTGASTQDRKDAPNNFVVYFSDRRGNYAGGAVAASASWPPLSPSGNETGEYGYSDFVNPLDKNACPNGVQDTGEDLDNLGTPGFFTYGEVAFPPGLLVNNGTANVSFAATLFTDGSTINATQADPNCASGTAGTNPWPGSWLKNASEARENQDPLFRRALKLVNGSLIKVAGWPTCITAGTIPCGLSVATENPMYIQGDYNSNSKGGGFGDPGVGAAVIADALTLLSNNWNDVNSLSNPFNPGQRSAIQNWYRMGVVAGKGLSFPIPGWETPALNGSQDFGTDGGVHNFMRFLEGWNGAALNFEGSLVSMHMNRQAIGLYKCCNTVYSPPTRGYQFDTNFLTPSLLPPRTPMLRDINTTGFTQLLLPNQ
jgi:hypothetical protein